MLVPPHTLLQLPTHALGGGVCVSTSDPTGFLVSKCDDDSALRRSAVVWSWIGIVVSSTLTCNIVRHINRDLHGPRQFPQQRLTSPPAPSREPRRQSCTVAAPVAVEPRPRHQQHAARRAARSSAASFGATAIASTIASHASTAKNARTRTTFITTISVCIAFDRSIHDTSCRPARQHPLAHSHYS